MLLTRCRSLCTCWQRVGAAPLSPLPPSLIPSTHPTSLSLSLPTSSLSFSSKEKHNNQSTPWPVTPRIIFKELGVRPLLTGFGYGLGSLFALSFIPSTELVPLLPQLVLGYLTAQTAFGVGGAVGTITGAKRCLIEGRWITKALPVKAVADAVANQSSLSEQKIQALAEKLRDGLSHPSFVPRLAGPIWRLVMNQAVPLDSLILVPTRIVDVLKNNNNRGVEAVVESVLVGVVAEGLDRVKSRARASGLTGVLMLYTAGTMLFVKLWPAPEEQQE